MDQNFKSGAELSDIHNTVALSMRDHAGRIVNAVVEFKELLMRYTCAMKEVRTKVEVLNTEYSIRYKRNPIIMIATRLKQTSSILEKMNRLGIPFSVENVENTLNDVAGVRIVCSYIDDIYAVAESLIRQDDVTLIRTKDYIKKPKPNGYRSLHLIVGIPVFFSDVKKSMKVEIQLRTVGMEYWAELEHQLKYKQEIPEEAAIVEELRRCAESLSEIDCRMLGLRDRIGQMAEKPTEEEILIDKLKRIDVPMS